ncbi:unnamed protein product [Paramecium primaurelia]|uniref:Uncharacterized protein n=1 Tax=Paramecium primaurelia TaxID=5886 RepID=A0A8S1QW45_PARPR|nr:unnamed protein product [Paramecium primaurelia]
MINVILAKDEICDIALPYRGCLNCKSKCQNSCLNCDTLGKGCLDCQQGCQNIDNMCKTICEDGFVTADEQCDDGNLIFDDGCHQCLKTCTIGCSVCDFGVCLDCYEGLQFVKNQCIKVNIMILDVIPIVQVAINLKLNYFSISKDMDVCNVKLDSIKLTINAIPFVEIRQQLHLNNVMMKILILMMDVINAYNIALFRVQTIFVIWVNAINVKKDFYIIRITVIQIQKMIIQPNHQNFIILIQLSINLFLHKFCQPKKLKQYALNFQINKYMIRMVNTQNLRQRIKHFLILKLIQAALKIRI